MDSNNRDNQPEIYKKMNTEQNQKLSRTKTILTANSYILSRTSEFNGLNAPEATRKLVGIGLNITDNVTREVMEFIGLEVKVRKVSQPKKKIDLTGLSKADLQAIAELIRDANKDNKEVQKELGI